jgi:hypothetical protein
MGRGYAPFAHRAVDATRDYVAALLRAARVAARSTRAATAVARASAARGPAAPSIFSSVIQ